MLVCCGLLRRVAYGGVCCVVSVLLSFFVLLIAAVGTPIEMLGIEGIRRRALMMFFFLLDNMLENATNLQLRRTPGHLS